METQVRQPLLAAFSHVLFDLDGTLTDPAEGITKSIVYALDKLGVRHEGPQSLLDFIGPPLRPALAERFGLSAEDCEQAVAFYRERFSTVGIYENRLFDGVPELLAALKAAGKTLGLATSKPEVYAERILQHFGLRGWFDQVTGASLDGSLAEKADVIAVALSRWPLVDPARVVMVGDRRHDLDGAREHGLAAIGLLCGFGDRAELEACCPLAVLADIPALTSAISG